VPLLQQTQAVLSQKLSSDMLGCASDYEKLIEDIKQPAFPETEPDSRGRTPSKYYLSELKSSEGKAIFKEDYLLELELSKEDGQFFFQNVRFNIFGSGFTKEDALKDFSEFFIHDYLSYKKTPPEDLTKDARQLLDEYESVISMFEPA
jgi:hypothetical protein